MNYTLIMPDGYCKPVLPFGKAWVASLRSGIYEQTEGTLERDGRFCCLGVLCCVQSIPTFGNCLDWDNPCRDVLGTDGEFPDGVFVITDNGRAKTLSSCNDVYALSFGEIADIIETVWECL